MKKQIISLIMVLSLVLGISSAVSAADAGNTSGSIEFKSGGVIINPPGSCTCCPKCCTCDTCGEDCECGCPCTCTCEDSEYNNFFVDVGVEDNLVFGEHDLTVNGVFDSANKDPDADDDHWTTDAGRFTGIEVKNQTASTAEIRAQIGKFMLNESETLKGFSLTMMKEAAIAQGGSTADVNGVTDAYAQYSNVKLTGDGAAIQILDVNTARMVKGAWHGLLDVIPGTAEIGNAQADLTWTLYFTP